MAAEAEPKSVGCLGAARTLLRALRRLPDESTPASSLSPAPILAAAALDGRGRLRPCAARRGVVPAKKQQRRTRRQAARARRVGAAGLQQCAVEGLKLRAVLFNFRDLGEKFVA
jgi:hypothetical protein